nr:hypothetical protein [Tanacetum cinerariifolium]
MATIIEQQVALDEALVPSTQRHQNTQQYAAMLPIELTNDEIRNIKAYKEYYAFATREAAPKPKASAKRKRSGSDTSITPPTATTTPTTTVAVTPKLTAAAKRQTTSQSQKRSSQQTHISQPGGSGTDKGTGSKPEVLDVPTDESEEELLWNSSDDEGVDDQEKVDDDDEGDEGNDSEEGEEDDDDDDDDEDKNEELYRDVNINQGRGIQATLDVEDSYVTLTLVHPDGQQESSSVSSHFVTSMLNPSSDAVAADLSEMELKKILIEKMEGNKSIHRSDEQRNLYKALVDAYEADKTILDSYGETVILKRRCDDDDDQDEGPSAGSDRGSKRWRKGKEPESTSALLETATRSTGRVDTLTPKLLAGPTFELMKGSCTSLIELEYHLEEPFSLISDNRGRSVIPSAHFINNDLEYLWGDYDKHALWGLSHWGGNVSSFTVSLLTGNLLSMYTPRGGSLPLYKFKEGDFKRLCLQDIEDMLLLLRCVEDLQLGIESYQKRLNLTKPDTYRSNLKRRKAYTAYSNPRGFIYQNKDKKNRMQYLPQTIWRKGDKDRAAAMIQAIDTMLKTRRIIRSLEKFVGGRLYEGDFRMLQRTI